MWLRAWNESIGDALSVEMPSARGGGQSTSTSALPATNSTHWSGAVCQRIEQLDLANPAKIFRIMGEKDTPMFSGCGGNNRVALDMIVGKLLNTLAT